MATRATNPVLETSRNAEGKLGLTSMIGPLRWVGHGRREEPKQPRGTGQLAPSRTEAEMVPSRLWESGRALRVDSIRPIGRKLLGSASDSVARACGSNRRLVEGGSAQPSGSPEGSSRKVANLGRRPSGRRTREALTSGNDFRVGSGVRHRVRRLTFGS